MVRLKQEIETQKENIEKYSLNSTMVRLKPDTSQGFLFLFRYLSQFHYGSIKTRKS